MPIPTREKNNELKSRGDERCISIQWQLDIFLSSTQRRRFKLQMASAAISWSELYCICARIIRSIKKSIKIEN